MKKRIIYNNIIGDVLAEGRACYFVRFPWGCRFIDKNDCYETWPVRETKEAFISDVIARCLNA